MRANSGYPATPSYEEMGKARPKKRKDERPCFDHRPLPVKFIVINENQVGREERRRNERLIAHTEKYNNSLGEKHRKRIS